MIYIVCSPSNKLDHKGRIAGWRHVPLDRKAKDSWKYVLAQMKTVGVENVIASDLDGEAANLAGSELGVPVRTEYGYRRFNVGRFHAKATGVVDGALRMVETKWKSNPDIPIREGDSLTSWRKRFVKNFQKLLDSGKDYLFVTDLRSIHAIRGNFDPHALIPNGNPICREKVFKVSKNGKP